MRTIPLVKEWSGECGDVVGRLELTDDHLAALELVHDHLAALERVPVPVARYSRMRASANLRN